MFIRLTASMSVAPQIAPSDCAAARAAGFAVLVNNRPDGEAAGQPPCAAMRAAADAAGLAYAAIPVDHSGLGSDQVDAMAAVLDAAAGPVLAFCRSGTRSTHLWALAEAKRGGDPDAIAAAALAGGFDIDGLVPVMRLLAGRA